MEKSTFAAHTPRLVLFGFALILLLLSFWGGLDNLFVRWTRQEEYSHGFFIPIISIWLLWKRRDVLVQSMGSPSWQGALLVLVAVFLLIIGELSAIFILIQLGFVIGLTGLVLALAGFSLLRVSLFPIVFLVFAIPMPYFIDAQLSWGLQLISSRLGVDMLRLLGISVHLQGNLIDLGFYKLQVVEACSGLRYLYPLLSLGFLAGYFFSAPLWQRILVFVSVVPITVFMNSFRISVIGALVNIWGTDMAEGFLHFFEGWVIFMGCAMILLLEIWLLDRLGKRRPVGELLVLPQVQPISPSGQGNRGTLSLLLSIAILGIVAVGVSSLDERIETVAPRSELNGFPLTMGNWLAREDYLPAEIEDALGVDDYLLANYARSPGEEVSFYIAYYASQRKGFSPHSPRVCLPGGGWQITDFQEVQYSPPGEDFFPVNRAVLELNSQRQLVYYWFEQRGRRIANEYWMKWYLLVDSIIMNRTDGALVRVITPIHPDEEISSAENRLQSLINSALPLLPEYVPDR